jgi:putative transposase
MDNAKDVITSVESTAASRFQMISPLLDASLDAAARCRLQEKIAAEHGVSTRTVYRYEDAYRKQGFAGLKPAGRSGMRPVKLPDNFDELMQEAILLKQKFPSGLSTRSFSYWRWKAALR